MTAVQAPPPGAVAAIPQWWYACLYTGGVAASDEVIRSVLPPVLAEVRALGASRWFFIRYFDEHGAHIRLRVFGPGRSLDRLVRTMTDVGVHLEAVAAMPREHAVELVPGAAAAVLGSGGSAVGLRPALYEPEVDKYGGLDGVELAERMFEFSSELALWAVSEHEKGGTRDALAALLLADTAGAVVLGARADAWPARRAVPWPRFWDVHAGWWTGSALGDPRFRGRLERAAAAARSAVTDRMRRTASSPGVEAWRRRWFRAIDDHLAEAGALGVPRTPQHLAFHQNHMLMNRLGYLPREEALLGMHARDWIAPGDPDTADERTIR